MSRLTRAVDLAVLLKARPRARTLADQVLPAASAAADNGRLWLVAAAVIGAVGGRQGRRAAAEGLLAIAVSSAAVNGPIKQLVRRPRPGTRIPRMLLPQRGRAPKTSSMPSGHATVAAAFAMAVGSRAPALALPISGVAGVVAWSRLNAGRHFASDVLVGLAAGGVVGAAVHWLSNRRWPPPAPEPVPAN